jgi:hypothetical protein
VLVAEWARLVKGYSMRMARQIEPGEVEATLAWLDPARDTQLARDIAKQLLERGHELKCVWTGAPLRLDNLDIDHCLPWSAWPCSDLWNLLPATRHVNQRRKRDRLPSVSALAEARERIIAWWEQAWLATPPLRTRFRRESIASLRVALDAPPEEVFAAIEWRRLRLREDQQLEEWAGV